MDVQEEDYDVEFRCFVFNGVKSNEKSIEVVRLLRPGTVPFHPILSITVVKKYWSNKIYFK